MRAVMVCLYNDPKAQSHKKIKNILKLKMNNLLLFLGLFYFFLKIILILRLYFDYHSFQM